MNPIFFGIFLSFILGTLFTILAIEYEIFNPLIMTIGDSIWYVLITVMTVGYGDIYAISYLGQITMIIATFSGIVFSSIFVVCVDEFLKMSENEKKAFMMLNRIKYK
jgi:voltage-gated potassium channel